MTDSINYDYKDMPITQDGEYVFSLNFYNGIKHKVWIAISVGVAIITAMIVVRIKGKKKADETFDQSVNYPSYNSQYPQNSTPMTYSQTQTPNTKYNTQTQNTGHQNTNQNKAHKECLDCDLNKEYYDNKEKILNNLNKKVTYCMYCGAPLNGNSKKCSSCNADLNR